MADDIIAKVDEVVAIDPIAEKDKQIAKLTEDRDNYKNVALKRLGKLPGDTDFVAGVDEKTGLTVEETVRKTLIEQNLIKAEEERNAEVSKVVRENSELKIALKNRPEGGLGGGGSVEAVEVKPNVFGRDQETNLREKTTHPGHPFFGRPDEFIESFTAKLNTRR